MVVLMHGDRLGMRMLAGAAPGKSPGLRACFTILLSAALLSSASMSAQPSGSEPGVHAAIGPAHDDFMGASPCATCHENVAKDFANNPHSRLALMHSGKSLTCESCHGPGKSHAVGGDDIARIFDPAKSTAKEVDDKCLGCHAGKHANFDRSAHRKGDVSCISCHSIHAAGVPGHLLKMADPQLCFQCHGDVKPQFSLPFHHKVEEGLMECTDCHDPHDTLGENAVRSSARQLMMCTKCHTATTGPFVYEHGAVKAEGCTACHFPHGGPNPQLLDRADVNTICQQCHLPSPNVTTDLPARPVHTQATQEQSCIACHSGIHGSNISNVLLSAKQERDER
jgi:DmsE family decaheme c-type cytochrome